MFIVSKISVARQSRKRRERKDILLMIEYHNELYSFNDFALFILSCLDRHDGALNSANIIIADPGLYEEYYLEQMQGPLTVGLINKMDRINVTLIESLSDLMLILYSHFQTGAPNKEISNLPPISSNIKVIAFHGIFSYFMKQGKILSETLDENRNRLRLDDILESSKPSFMELKDYSAKTVNHICYLMNNLMNYKKYDIILNDPSDENISSKGPYTPPLWNEQLPNLQPDRNNADSINEEDENSDGSRDEGLDFEARSVNTSMGSKINAKDKRLIIFNDDNDDDSDNNDDNDNDVGRNENPLAADDSIVDNHNEISIKYVPLGLILSKWVKIM